MYNRKYTVGVLLTNLVLTELLEGFPNTLSVRGKLPYYFITHTSAVSTTSTAACRHLAGGWWLVAMKAGTRWWADHSVSAPPYLTVIAPRARPGVVTGGTTDRAGMC